MNHARRSEARPIDLSSSTQPSRQPSRKSGNSGCSGKLKFWWSNDGNNHRSALIGHQTTGHTSTLGSSLALLSLSSSQALKLAIGQEINAGGMQQEWVEGGTYFLGCPKGRSSCAPRSGLGFLSGRLLLEPWSIHVVDPGSVGTVLRSNSKTLLRKGPQCQPWIRKWEI